MIFLLSLIAINFLIISSLVSCGKKDTETVKPNGGTLCRDKEKNKDDKIAEKIVEKSSDGSKVELDFTAENIRIGIGSDSDIYHHAASKNAYPASKKCQNHEDSWRMLALYLDYIRSVNPEDFERNRLLDSGMAVLHDITNVIGYDQSIYSSEMISLSIVYFLVTFHGIKVNLGTDINPWFMILCKHAKWDLLENMKLIIERELIESKIRSTTAVIEKEQAGAIKM